MRQSVVGSRHSDSRHDGRNPIYGLEINSATAAAKPFSKNQLLVVARTARTLYGMASPESYGLVQQVIPVEREEIFFASCNAWDALGATCFGFTTLWVHTARVTV